MPSWMFLRNQYLGSGFFSPMTQWQGKDFYIHSIRSLLKFSSTTSIEGFWAHGLGKDGAIRVGDDDEGA